MWQSNPTHSWSTHSWLFTFKWDKNARTFLWISKAFSLRRKYIFYYYKKHFPVNKKLWLKVHHTSSYFFINIKKAVLKVLLSLNWKPVIITAIPYRTNIIAYFKCCFPQLLFAFTGRHKHIFFSLCYVSFKQLTWTKILSRAHRCNPRPCLELILLRISRKHPWANCNVVRGHTMDTL